jgi:hypothetical protein
MRRVFGYVVGTLLIWVIVALAIWHQQFWWWCEVHFGMVNEPGPYYGFWSGFGSDLGEYVIVGGVAQIAWHQYMMHNCHDPEGFLPWGCWRIGRHDAAGGMYKLCWKHHPDIGQRLTRDLIHRHHHEHRHSSIQPPGVT